jgi:hypothetical protein
MLSESFEKLDIPSNIRYPEDEECQDRQGDDNFFCPLKKVVGVWRWMSLSSAMSQDFASAGQPMDLE